MSPECDMNDLANSVLHSATRNETQVDHLEKRLGNSEGFGLLHDYENNSQQSFKMQKEISDMRSAMENMTNRLDRSEKKSERMKAEIRKLETEKR